MSGSSTSTVLTKDEFADFKKKHRALRKIQQLPRAADPEISELIKTTLTQLASAAEQLSIAKTPEAVLKFERFKQEVAQNENTIIEFVVVRGEHPAHTEKENRKWI